MGGGGRIYYGVSYNERVKVTKISVSNADRLYLELACKQRNRRRTALSFGRRPAGRHGPFRRSHAPPRDGGAEHHRVVSGQRTTDDANPP